MDWITRLNMVIAHMEENIAEEIDYTRLAKIACCSPYQFQRMFSYIAGLPLPKYIRRRKMSLAAVDLKNEGMVIDVTLKYGYASPTAFNRAFQSIHGIAPSRAKKAEQPLKSYPILSFKLIAKGVDEMEFKIVKRETIRVLGAATPMNTDLKKHTRKAKHTGKRSYLAVRLPTPMEITQTWAQYVKN